MNGIKPTPSQMDVCSPYTVGLGAGSCQPHRVGTACSNGDIFPASAISQWPYCHPRPRPHRGGGGFLSAKRISQHENVYGFAQQKLKVWTDRLQGTDVRPRVLLGLRWVCRIG